MLLDIHYYIFYYCIFMQLCYGIFNFSVNCYGNKIDFYIVLLYARNIAELLSSRNVFVCFVKSLELFYIDK